MTSLFTLDIQQFRNIERTRLTPLSSFNVFYGANGAGKTSVLEAVALLCQGKSFRSSKAKTLIRYGQDTLLVFTQTGAGRRFGHKRSKDGFELKVDGESCSSLSSVAQELPFILLDNNTSDLLVGSPGLRRSYIDWLLFHVEHSQFHSVWLSYKKLLKQRNELLKKGFNNEQELAVWDKSLIQYGEILAAKRRHYMDKVSVSVISLYQKFGFDFGSLKIDFVDGWKSGVSFQQALTESRERDLRYKTTHVGPHRFDIKVTVDDVAAAEVLSRGQIKSLAQLFMLSNAVLLCELKQQNTPLLLIDDFGAELDKHNRSKLLTLISRYNMQVFVSCIDKNEVLAYLPDGVEPTMFHVEQGNIVNEKKI